MTAEPPSIATPQSMTPAALDYVVGTCLAKDPESAAAREITAVRDDTIRLADEGNLNGSAQRFVDYWAGDGTWVATPETRRWYIPFAFWAGEPSPSKLSYHTNKLQDIPFRG